MKLAATFFSSRMSDPRSIFTCATLGLLLNACSGVAFAQFLGTPPVTPDPSTDSANAVQRQERGQFSSLLPGDLFEVQVFGVPQYDYKARIDDDGSTSLPLIGKVQLAGMSMADAERSIAGKLAATNNIKDPHVFVHIVESPNHFVTVSGEVKNPGAIQVYGDKYLMDVISAAGGFTPLSSPMLTIYRRASQTPIQIQLPSDPALLGSKNINVYPGDNVVVSKVGVIYVLGAFHQQGALPLRNNAQVTLLEAMSLAGGVNYEAAANKAYILRSGPAGQVEIPFNVNDVLKHRVADRVLLNEDIILIPTNNMRAALKGGAAGVAASLLAGIGYITVK